MQSDLHLIAGGFLPVKYHCTPVDWCRKHLIEVPVKLRHPEKRI